MAVAAVAIATDIMAGVNSGRFQPRSLGQHWFDLHPPSLNLSQALIQRYVHPSVWVPIPVIAIGCSDALRSGVPGDRDRCGAG